MKLPIGYSVFLLLLQLLFFHLNLSLNSLFRFPFSLVCLTLGLFKGRENERKFLQTIWTGQKIHTLKIYTGLNVKMALSFIVLVS